MVSVGVRSDWIYIPHTLHRIHKTNAMNLFTLNWWNIIQNCPFLLWEAFNSKFRLNLSDQWPVQSAVGTGRALDLVQQRFCRSMGLSFRLRAAVGRRCWWWAHGSQRPLTSFSDRNELLMHWISFVFVFTSIVSHLPHHLWSNQSYIPRYRCRQWTRRCDRLVSKTWINPSLSKSWPIFSKSKAICYVIDAKLMSVPKVGQTESPRMGWPGQDSRLQGVGPLRWGLVLHSLRFGRAPFVP